MYRRDIHIKNHKINKQASNFSSLEQRFHKVVFLRDLNL